MKAFGVVWACLFLSYFSSAGTISLTADTSPPDPNDEITVWVHTDEPLLFMQLGVYVNGDATITSAMSEADCNDFGWENGWGSDPEIDPTGWACLNGLCWAADANDIVGYFKFRYNSGQVAVYIDQENSLAGNWGNNFTFSTESLLFGEIVLPPLKEPNEPTAVFLQCPAGSSGPSRGESESFAGWSQQMEMLEMPDSDPIVYVIDSDITENQVWDANDIYYIVGDPNNSYIVDVNSLLVIEPGTTVVMGYQSGLHVSDGGALIANGTPDRPIIFTPDWFFFDYPDYVGYYWQVYDSYGPYYHAIYIEDTAFPLTTIRYCMIEGAVGGIITDNIRLDNAIENNYLFGNAWGVYEFGPLLTDVTNNLCFYQDQAAIEIELCPDPNGLADLDHEAKIEHNTCDGSGYTYCGITVHGVADPNNSGIPTIYLTNNVVTGNYNYGLNLVDGAMYALVVSTGYYGNYYDKRWEFGEYNPVVTETNPYYPSILDYPWQHHYLVDDAVFVNAGLQYIEQTKLIGTTTNYDSLPDKDRVDLGFHHIDWNYVSVEGIAGTDIDDLITLSNYWLTYTPYDPNSPGYIDPNLYIYDPNHPENWIDPNFVSFGGDWNDDGFVDLADFAVLAGLWQVAKSEPNIIPIISDSISDGWIRIGVSGFTPQTQSVFAFINGKYVGKIFDFVAGHTLDVDMSESGSQSQQLKLITLDWNGQIKCSSPINFTVSLGLNYCILPQNYDPNEPLNFVACNNEPNDVTVEVYADAGQLVWSQTFSGNSIRGSIPAVITGNYEIERVYFDADSGTSIVKSTDKKIPLQADPNVKALIVLPFTLINMLDFRTIGAVEDAFENKGIKCLKLTGSQASYVNIAKYAPQIRYLYINTHGHWSFEDSGPGVPRTNVDLADGTCVSAKASDFVGTPPIWCKDPLPGNLEQTTHSFASMGFTNLRLFYNDSCLGGHLTIGPATGTLVVGRSGQQGLTDIPHNDMSLACGMTSSSQSRFYQGWFNESESFVPLPLPKPIDWGPIEAGETSFQKFSRLEWEALGGTRNLYEALGEAISGQNEFGNEDAVNNYRIKGQEFLTDVRVQSN
jgi:hypothetical protein